MLATMETVKYFGLNNNGNKNELKPEESQLSLDRNVGL